MTWMSFQHAEKGVWDLRKAEQTRHVRHFLVGPRMRLGYCSEIGKVVEEEVIDQIGLADVQWRYSR